MDVEHCTVYTLCT